MPPPLGDWFHCLTLLCFLSSHGWKVPMEYIERIAAFLSAILPTEDMHCLIPLSMVSPVSKLSRKIPTRFAEYCDRPHHGLCPRLSYTCFTLTRSLSGSNRTYSPTM